MATETQKEYKGSVTFRGKAYYITLDKTKLYGYETVGGGWHKYEPRLVMLTGEIWVGQQHQIQTREAKHVSEVVSDIQTMLDSLPFEVNTHGVLQLQVRTEVLEYINDKDVEDGWPRAMKGNFKRYVASHVVNFELEPAN